ncbi:hypothetical protein MNV49_000396 [Pseudohyphozyma bogoriensis]|nr:hypothetical protein MNV49_000396 [Pseudohyphozyma bogoriensis]
MQEASFEPSIALPELYKDGRLRDEIVLVPGSGFIFGFVSGLMTSSRLASRQFLAENAHRQPTTVQGWYFYQKTKNYRVLYRGIIGGMRTGSRVAFWSGAFVALSEGIELGVRRTAPEVSAPYKTRWASGAVAGATLTALGSQLYRLSRYGGVRRMFMGASFGAIAGGCIDLRDWMRETLKLEKREV